MEDSELYQLLADDSEQGLYELIRKYKGYVWQIVHNVLGGYYQDVEECVADVFFQFWEYRKSISLETGTIKGLLACMARNTAINRYHRIKREACSNIEREYLASEDEIESLIDNIYQKEVVELLLNDLKGKHKDIFIKRHVFMESIGEISSDMGLNERQVRNSLYQSKKKLKKNCRIRENSKKFRRKEVGNESGFF